MEIILSYKPIAIKSEKINKEEFLSYLKALSDYTTLTAVVIDPLENAMKESKKEEFTSDNIKVKKQKRIKKSIKWKNVVFSLKEFLKIRAEDSRTKKIKELKYFDGLGYCIEKEELLAKIENEKEKNTSEEEVTRLIWPMKNKEDYPKNIVIPSLDYSKINKEKISIGLKAKSFRKGLEKKVIKAYKTRNKLWLKEQTGFSYLTKKQDDLESIALPEKSIFRSYVVDETIIIGVYLILKKEPDYKKAIHLLEEELKKSEKLKWYKTKTDKGNVFINIRNIEKRLEEFLKPKEYGKYIISP